LGLQAALHVAMGRPGEVPAAFRQAADALNLFGGVVRELVK
jgi:hypothetical protein